MMAAEIPSNGTRVFVHPSLAESCFYRDDSGKAGSRWYLCNDPRARGRLVVLPPK